MRMQLKGIFKMMIIENIENIKNQYVVEYMKQREDNILRTYEYIPWIIGKHDEYRKLNNMKEFEKVNKDDFLDWLRKGE